MDYVSIYRAVVSGLSFQVPSIALSSSNASRVSRRVSKRVRFARPGGKRMAETVRFRRVVLWRHLRPHQHRPMAW